MPFLSFGKPRRQPGKLKTRDARRLFLEPLEARHLMATVSVAYFGPDGNENGENVKFLVTRDVSDSSPLTVNFTLSGTATSGTDYTSATSVTIPAWMSSEFVSLPVTNDGSDEGLETVILNISSSGSYTIGTGSATQYIYDNDIDVTLLPFITTLAACPTCRCDCPPKPAGVAMGSPSSGTTTASFWAGGSPAPSGASSIWAHGSPGPAGSSSWVAPGSLGSSGSSPTFDSPPFIGLRYDSSTAQPIGLMQVDGEFGISQRNAQGIEVEFFWNGATFPTKEKTYNTSQLDANEAYRFSAAVSASSLGTGYYPWSVDVKTYNAGNSMWVSNIVQGGTRVVDRTQSEFGVGWAAEIVDRLKIQSNGALWSRGDGGVWWFSKDGSGNYTRENGEPGYSTLVYSGGNYTLTQKDGEKLVFNGNGLMTKRQDRQGNEINYAYTDADSDSVADEISTITDTVGRVTTFGYTSGLVTTITDPYSNVTTLGYTSGKLTSVTQPDPDGAGGQSAAVTTFTYSGNLLATMTDGESNTTQFTYSTVPDNVSFLSQVEYPGSAEEDIETIFALALASNTALVKVSDLQETRTSPTGSDIVTERDKFGQPTKVTDDDGNTTTIIRDGQGRPTQVTSADPDGVGGESAYVTEYGYDANGNLILVEQPDGTTLEWTYNLTFNVPTEYTDALGNVTLWTLDSTLGYVMSERRVVGQVDDGINLETDDVVTSFTYTAAPSLSTDPPAGLISSITDALGRVTEFEFDEWGNLLLVTYAVGTALEATVEYEYTDDLVTAMIDELGRRTEFVYDNLSRLIETTLPDPDAGGPLASPVLAMEYDANNQIVAVIDALGRETAFTYDSRNNRTHVTRPDHDGDTNLTVTELVYNLSNQLITLIDPLGRETAYQYDDQGRIDETTLPDPDGVGGAASPVFGTTYDALGRVKTTTDALLNVTTYAYSNFGKTVTVTLPDPDGVGGASSPVLIQEFDAAGNLISETDALGNETTYDYDALGRLVLVVQPDPDGVGGDPAPETEYLYDKIGNLNQIIDPLGNRTVYDYDLRDRRIAERHSTGALPTIEAKTTTEATRVSEVQLVGFSDDDSLFGGDFTLTYDGQTTGSIAFNASAAAVQTALEALSNLGPGDVAVTKPTNTSQSQIWQITFTGSLAGTNVAQTTVDASNVMGMMGITEIETTTTAGSSSSEVQTVTLSGATGGTFRLDFGGQVTTAIAYNASAGDVDTALEALSTIDSVTVSGSAGGPYTITFTGTHVGNNVTPLWPQGTALTNAADLEVTTLYGYDDASQLTSVTDPLNRVTTNLYDNLGRLIQITAPDPDGAGGASAPETEYAYDAANRLISITDAMGNVTEFAYDALDNQVLITLADPDGGGSLLAPETEYVFDDAGQLLEMIDPMGRDTDYEYDGLGRRKKITLPDPDGAGGVARPYSTFTFDAMNNLLTATDPLSHVTTYDYDNLYRRTSITDAETGVTSFSFDAMGRMLSLTDPESNTTSWVYDNLGRKIEETNELSQLRTFKYDAVGNLTERVDRLGRKIVWEYDDLYRNTHEKWYDGVTLVHTMLFEYDAASQLVEATDTAASYGYEYDGLGRVIEESQSFGSFSPLIVYERDYNANSRVTDVRSIIGGTADFENELTYDNLSRLTRLDQSGQSGGNAVAEKRVDFAYDVSGAYTKINRYADLAGSEYVASAHYWYDGMGRLSKLLYAENTTPPGSGWGTDPLAGYVFTYDAASRIASIDSYADGLTTYAHDDTNQLTTADHSGQTDEGYAYDANGNRTGGGYDVDPNNQLASDGVNNYTHDDEGNRLTKTNIATGATDEYTWDHRNRLIRVTFKNAGGTVIKTVEQTYDVNNRWIRREIDPDGSTGSAVHLNTFFSHLDGQIALEFDGTTASDLTNRYLWSDAVDQLMA